MKEFLNKSWQIIWGTIVHFNEHNCSIMAAGMSFFGMLSLIPLTLLGVSLLGYVLGSSAEAQQFVSKLLDENFPKSATEILNHINAIVASPQRAFVNGLSALGLVWSGIRFFNILQGVLNSIWVGAKPRHFLWNRIFSFVIFVAAGLLFWLTFIVTSLTVAIKELNIAFRGIRLSDFNLFWLGMDLAVLLTGSIIMYFLIYKFIPNTKVSLRAALIGAIFTAVFLQLLRLAFGTIIMRFDSYGSLYGPLASFILFMSWLYLSMTVLLLGAELGSRFQEVLFKQKSKRALNNP